MDDKLRNSLDQLDEEQTSDLLENDINFNIDRMAIDRIKSSVYKKVRADTKPSIFSRKLMACAAALILVFSTMFALGFDDIAAAVKHVIEYIPGLGKVPEKISTVPTDSSRNMLEVKVMEEPAFLEVQGEKIEIYSSWLSIYKDQVIVTAILRYPQSVNLHGEIAIEYNGEKISRDGEVSLPDNEKTTEMTYIYTIKNPEVPINTLTFTTENSKVDIAFEKSKDLSGKIISQNFDGIILSAIPLNQNRSKFVLTSTYDKDLDGVMFISSLSTGLDAVIRAVDDDGNEYDVKKSTSQGSEYYVAGNIKGKIVSLKFNKLYQSFKYENNTSLQGVKFKVPQVDEKVSINKSLDNIISSINLKTVERGRSTHEGICRLIFTYEMKSKIASLDISNIALYVEKNGGVMAGSILEKYKDGDSYVVKYEVLADEYSAYNTVSITSYLGSYYWNTLLLDKECILNFNN